MEHVPFGLGVVYGERPERRSSDGLPGSREPKTWGRVGDRRGCRSHPAWVERCCQSPTFGLAAEGGGRRPGLLPDRFEVLVFRQFSGRQLVGAIELIGPGNKDSDETREAFAMKVASYLHEGVCVLIVDVVTERRANLHDEIVRLMHMPADLRLPPEPPLYAATYRPVIRENRPQIDIWVNAFNVGDPLPTMPLRLIADYFVPVELEATYMEACRRRRLVS